MVEQVKKEFNPFTVSEWIAWLGATIIACASLTAFAYQTFQTKDAASEHKTDIVHRLDRIETKVDELLKK